MVTIYRIAICDDNLLDSKKMQKVLENCLNHLLDVEFFLYQSGEELLKNIEKKYHLVIIDMQMDGLDGIETARKVRETNKRAVIVFYSGVHDPNPENFETEPFRFIRKDVSTQKLNEECNKILEKVKANFQNNYLQFEKDGKVIQIDMSDVMYIERIKYGCNVYLLQEDKLEKIKITKYKLDEIYDIFKEFNFEYAHNSYIVNMRKIRIIDNNFVVFENGKEMNISRSRRETLKKRLFDTNIKDDI